MGNIKVDLVKMQDSGKAIFDLAIKYEQLVSMFYDRINQITNKSNEWIGPDAERFVENINLKKKAYEAIGTTLKEYGQFLMNTSNIILKEGEKYIIE